MSKKEIKDAGLKVTLPRLQILEFLSSNKGKHFTAEDLYDEMRSADHDIGLATIYRVLNQFETAGLVSKNQFENTQAVYELDTGEHHDHMVDVDSGKVTEFYDEELEQLQVKIVEKHGFELIDHKLVLYVKKISIKSFTWNRLIGCRMCQKDTSAVSYMVILSRSSSPYLVNRTHTWVGSLILLTSKRLSNRYTNNWTMLA